MIRILVADDHPVVRRGLKQILAEDPELAVPAEAQDGHEVLALVRAHPWDVVLLDLTLPDRSGLEVLKEVKRERPKLPVLVLSIHPEEQFALRVLKAGAAGYLTKGSAPQELVAAVRKVAGGGRYISAGVAEQLAIGLERSDRPPHEALSDREDEILRLIASGKTVTQIAAHLALSVKTVSTYRARILEKMHMSSNAELIHYAARNHLAD